MHNAALILFALIALAACDRDEPPAPSAEQSDQLNEAEAMLNNADMPKAE